jgi:hypothetical protein
MSYKTDSLVQAIKDSLVAAQYDSIQVAREAAAVVAQEQSDSYVVKAYLIYLPIAILLTAIVSHKLFKSGRVFMLDIFNGKEDIAHSTNKLFELGFYLINIGFALKILYISHIGGSKQLIEALSSKIGFFAIYLGVMLFANLFLFFRGKKVAGQKRRDRKMYEQKIKIPTVS